MNFLSLFVLIPLVMLLGLWLARDVKGVRAVMVTGSTLLLILAGYLTITFLGDRAAGATDEMLYTASFNWFEPLHIKYSVGVDGISVAMLLLSSVIVFTGTFASWQLKPLTKEYFLVVHIVEPWCVRFLHFGRHVRHVHVLRNSPYPDVPPYRCVG